MKVKTLKYQNIKLLECELIVENRISLSVYNLSKCNRSLNKKV